MTIIKFPNIKKVEYDSDAFLDSFLDVCKRVQELDKLLQTNWIDQNLEYKIGGLLNMGMIGTIGLRLRKS